uniref:C2H2-type domain-containing protein n=1 Tax=Eptatretus burgeri TaxID=7764 RepID=A0A8C4NMZ7_EPTBU
MKIFRSKAGLNYHEMVAHTQPLETKPGERGEGEDRQHLAGLLRHLGKLRCRNEGCGARFLSISGYRYHAARCQLSSEPLKVQPRSTLCPSCGKEYRSYAGYKYHARKAHGEGSNEEMGPEREAESLGVPGRLGGPDRRQSASVARLLLRELATDMIKGGQKNRNARDDLVPAKKLVSFDSSACFLNLIVFLVGCVALLVVNLSYWWSVDFSD